MLIVEVEKWKDGRDIDGYVELMFLDGFFISDVFLKMMIFVVYVDDDDLEVVKFLSIFKSVSFEEGFDNCIDFGVISGEFSVGKELLFFFCNV